MDPFLVIVIRSLRDPHLGSSFVCEDHNDRAVSAAHD